MKTSIVFVSLLAVAVLGEGDSTAQSCFNDIVEFCESNPSKGVPEIENCSAKYGAFHKDNIVLGKLQKFTNMNLAHSFDFLLMATYYDNYLENRQGFHNLFQKLSDKMWEDTIDLIKYMTKRGGSMNFRNKPETKYNETIEVEEIQSMAQAVDRLKELAKEAFQIHKTTIQHSDTHHDPELSSYIEEQFTHEHARLIRDLAGYTEDLKKISSDKQLFHTAELGVHLFDEYLRKVY